MGNELQNFLADATQKAAADLIAAAERLPEQKRCWSPGGQARTALDQAAECAILNGVTARVIQLQTFPPEFSMEAYERERAELRQEWSRAKSQLEENAARVVAAIRSVNSDDLSNEIEMPWGKMRLDQIMAYPYWNMSYHEGQTNYIAAILEQP